MDKVEHIATSIIDSFNNGTLPTALANLFITTGSDDIPSDKWSWGNRMLIVLKGHVDARGYKQWLEVGRKVGKGNKAIYILAPMTRKTGEVDEQGKDVVMVTGFRPIPVFGYSQTEGDELIDHNQEFIDELPVIEVARRWGIRVVTRSSLGTSVQGSTDASSVITLRSLNLAAWAHELVHCADQRNVGELKSGQHVDQEVVAELGSAVLLSCLGLEVDADLGGALLYIAQYTGGKQTIRACNELVSRTCEAVKLILEEVSSDD